MNNEKYSKALVAIDGSYFLYFTIFAAVKQWQAKSPNAIIIKDAEETDQSNLPVLTKYSDFCKILEYSIIRKINDVDKIVTKVIEDDDVNINVIHKIFTLDSPLYNNWRKKIYPEYKAQRKITPKQFNVNAIMEYVVNVLEHKLSLSSLGYHIIKIDRAEGDDILATAMMSLSDYSKKILIASDKDFLQLENVEQYDLFGARKEILPKLRAKTNESISPKEYLIFKTLVGDGADNIPNVFKGVGETRALKLVKNNALLVSKLKEDMEAAKQFKLNRTIIGFDFIPDDLKNNIINHIKPLFEEDTKDQMFEIYDEDLINL